jgi:hypothetical protein
VYNYNIFLISLTGSPKGSGVKGKDTTLILITLEMLSAGGTWKHLEIFPELYAGLEPFWMVQQLYP